MKTRRNIGRRWTGAAGGLAALLIAGCPGPVILSDANLNANAAPNDPAPTEQEIRDSLENTPPEAKAGDDLTVAPGDQVTLSATASTDADRDRLSFFWQQLEGDAEIEFDGTIFSSVVKFTAPQVEAETTVTFVVFVVDGFSATSDEVMVTIAPE